MNSLVVPRNGRLVPLSKLTTERDPNTMAAAAAISSPFSSQEHNDLPFTRHIDNPFCPPPSGQAALADENVPSLGTSGMSLNLQDMDDFEKEFPTKPAGQGMVLLQSTKASVENTIIFQHLCDQHHVIPNFEYEQPFPQNWKAKVVVGDETIGTTEVFPSKPYAKEALSKLALERFPSLNLSAGTGMKRKVDNSNLTAVDKSENWIGLLNDNFLRIKLYAPTYQEFRTETTPFRFSCEVSLNGGPLEPFQGGLCSSIKDAKAAAAKLAVEWLRNERVMITPVKRPKPDVPPPSHTGVTQTLDAVGLDKERQESPSSYRQRLHQLVASLGFIQPAWQIHHSALAGKPAATNVPIYDASVRFTADAVAREPSLEGAIGLVEQVHGINNAKEACCERVLTILEDIKQSRQMV